jgi:succinate dehydrogenase/fumarate reductase cytochrome b subunit
MHTLAILIIILVIIYIVHIIYGLRFAAEAFKKIEALNKRIVELETKLREKSKTKRE